MATTYDGEERVLPMRIVGSEAVPGSNATSATAVQGVDGGKAVSVARTGIVPIKNAAADFKLVAKGSAGNLHGFNLCNGASAGFLFVYDGVAAPIDGVGKQPVLVLPVAANAALSAAYDPPLAFTTGITLVFSTTGPFEQTAANTGLITAWVA
ncbi:hypothetical protein KOAAANKH_02543 [Brevundimonas sp. NIBR10]|uniref:hypothetical protein n=1 Tax=Brevundimonas sp. NIBR10 TaxID=3015997 RepID=UPI0022F17C26|nr:hypothetical protein [Brevundimonas sp. NIBR10]WGM47661.1 hypothetical protein KOAAANKH_02543 [Brevundimonas sp. NIBR10]